ATLERRRQQELRAQAANLAESPTLKAAVDTYAAERGNDDASRRQLLATIRRELDKLSSRVDADAILLVDERGASLAASGKLADRWLPGRPMIAPAQRDRAEVGDTVLQSGGEALRVITIPLVLDDGVSIGSLELVTALDRRYAEQL